MADTDPLDDLKADHWESVKVAFRIERDIWRCRQDGFTTWAEIGNALGVSTQAVNRRYSFLDRLGEDTARKRWKFIGGLDGLVDADD
jgi:hypothetical protein